jgi:hypothetical protein
LDVAAHAMKHVVGVIVENTGFEAVLHLARSLEIDFTGTLGNELWFRYLCSGTYVSIASRIVNLTPVC